MGEIVAASTTDDQAALDAAVLPEAGRSDPEDSLKVESTTDEPSAVESVQGEGKPKSAYQKRIDKLVKERETERKRNRDLEERLRRYEVPETQPSEVPIEAPQQNAAVEDYGGMNQSEAAFYNFVRSHPDAHVIGPILATNEALCNKLRLMLPGEAWQEMNVIGERGRAEAAEKEQVREARLDEARERHSDFDQVAFRDIPVYAGILEQIKSHPQGAELQYLLGSDPALARELSEMPVELAMGRAGSILESFAGGRRVSVVSSPPAPIRPVGGSPARSASRIDDENIDYQTFKRLREPQEKAWRSGIRR